jgi:hypothetical protein
MRRQNSNLNEEVILFLGECEILAIMTTHQIVLASRTLLLKEDVLLTYQNPMTSLRESRLSRTKPVSLERLTSHERTSPPTQTSTRSPRPCGRDCWWAVATRAWRPT